MNEHQLDLIRQAVIDRAAAAFRARGAFPERLAVQLGVSEHHAKRLMSNFSSKTGIGLPATPRKARNDKGSGGYTREQLLLVGGYLSEGRRENGKSMWSIERAIDVAYANGKLPRKLSAAYVGKLLRAHYLHPDQILAPAPATRMRTRHPNYLWQQDASICVIYLTPLGEIRIMESDMFHRNKLEKGMKVLKDLVVRFVVVDHASGCISARYYLGGEKTTNALESLIWTIVQRKDEHGRGLPFHGVPLHLYTDQGSAFKSGEFNNFCAELGITLKRHKPKNSRATGSVETGQNIVERGMESVLKFLDPENITMASLNELADVWMNAYNGSKKHGRHGMTRYGAWSLIDAQTQLRVMNDADRLRSLPATAAEERRVSDDMLVSFAVKGHGSHDYDVRQVRGAAPRERLLVKVNPFNAPSVRVGATDRKTGEITWHDVAPIVRDRFGFDESAPVYGEEYRAMPNTVVDENRNAIARQAYATAAGPATLEAASKAKRAKVPPFRGQFDPLADLKAAQVPTYMPKVGTEHPVARREPAIEILSCVAACAKLKARLRDAYQPSFFGWINQRFPDGVPADQLEAIAGQLTAADAQPQETATQNLNLRIVGGAA